MPDLLREKQHTKKRQIKVVRRFAKELWGQKILQHMSKRSSSRRSSSSFAPDVSLLGPGASSIQPSWGRTKSIERSNKSISQLERIGLTPEPETKPSKSPRTYSQRGLTDVAHRGIMKIQKHKKASHTDKANHSLPAESVLESPSDQLFSQSFEVQQVASDSSKNQISHSINSPRTGISSDPDSLQEMIEKNSTGCLTVEKDKSRVFLQSSAREPAGPLGTFSQVRSPGSTPPNPKERTVVKQKKSRVGSIDSGQDQLSKSTSGFNLPQISHSHENHPDTGHDRNIAMAESSPMQIDSDQDGESLPPAPRHARIVRRGTSGILAVSLRMAPSMGTFIPARPAPPPPILTSPPSHFVFPSKSIKGHDYLSADPVLEQTLGALNVPDKQAPRPYQVEDSLTVKDDDLPGAVKHVDFTDTELDELLTIICHLQGVHRDSSTALKDQLKGAVSSLSYSEIAQVARLANETSGLVSLRQEKPIRRFLRRLQQDNNPTTPSIVRVEAAQIGPDRGMTKQTLLRRRENGLGRDEFSIQRQLREAMIETFTPQRSWKGASGDIVSIAWNPNSQTYTVGATATSNAEDLQYNRPNNLLYGDVNHNTLHELPDHYIDRPRPETIAEGPNASEAVYAACDPKVYKTVSAIQYSANGTRMFTASHDKTVKVWDVPVDGLPSCSLTLAHDAILAQLSASTRLPNVFATGSQTTAEAIRVYYQPTADLESSYNCISLGSTRAQAKPRHEIYPECLTWGNTPMTESFLLAGFARWGDLPDNNPGRQGDLCIWDLRNGQKLWGKPPSQSVTAASFHPFMNTFGTGGAPGTGVNRRKNTRTVVRMWDMRHDKFSMELDCPALDMGDLVFHPVSKDIVAVGCTDGAVYVWDMRNPEYFLHKLQHGEPISDWDNKYGESPLSREQGDAGVTMTLWSSVKNHLYTGATDGMVKLWDVNRAPEDVLVNNVTQLEAGVASATFSPDYTSLLIGDSTGGLHLLNSGPGYLTEEEQKFGPGPIRYIGVPRNDPPAPDDEPGQGQLAAQELLSSGQLTMHDTFGVGQGPAYKGPYAAYAHEKGPPSMARLLPEFEKQQPVSRRTGRERENEAARNIKGTHERRRYELELNREPPPGEEPPAVPEQKSSNKPSSNKKRKRNPRPTGSLEDSARKKARMSSAAVGSTIDDNDDDDPQDGDMSDQMDVDDDDDDEMQGFDTEDERWFPDLDYDVFAQLGIHNP